ncbi:MAG TPA: PilN domain-containing protein [Candidatus Acidoferrum sp.]|nr:PilN domain-containing protein [Candidatus Acidoferrum sp.]
MIRINLAPPRERAGVRLAMPGLNLGAAFGVAGVVLAVLIVGSALYLFREERQLAAEVEASARELNSLRAIVGPAARMREHLAEIQARLKAVQGLTKDQGRPLSLIDAFADVVPADLWITGLEDSGAVLRVTGSAFSPTAVSNLMAALRASGKFRDVDIVVSKRELDKVPDLVTFEITCRFET